MHNGHFDPYTVVGGELWENDKELYVFGMELTLKKPLKGTVDILGKIQYFIFLFFRAIQASAEPIFSVQTWMFATEKKAFSFLGFNWNEYKCF